MISLLPLQQDRPAHVLYRILEPLDLACDLVTLRCVPNGQVEVPHLTDAGESVQGRRRWYLPGWRSRVIFETQGPIGLSCLSIGKCELGLGRNVLAGDEHAHGSGTSVVQTRIGRIALWVDDRRHQLCCQKAAQPDCVLKLYRLGSASRGCPLSHAAKSVRKCHQCLSCAGCLVDDCQPDSLQFHDGSQSWSVQLAYVGSVWMVQSADWRAAPPNSLLWLRTVWIFICHVCLFLCHYHRFPS